MYLTSFSRKLSKTAINTDHFQNHLVKFDRRNKKNHQLDDWKRQNNLLTSTRLRSVRIFCTPTINIGEMRHGLRPAKSRPVQ